MSTQMQGLIGLIVFTLGIAGAAAYLGRYRWLPLIVDVDEYIIAQADKLISDDQRQIHAAYIDGHLAYEYSNDPGKPDGFIYTPNKELPSRPEFAVKVITLVGAFMPFQPEVSLGTADEHDENVNFQATAEGDKAARLIATLVNRRVPGGLKTLV